MSHQQKPAEARHERKRWIELSVPQLLAGALAAASAAVAASWLGVAGTVLGAVVASVVVSVSSALYARPDRAQLAGDPRVPAGHPGAPGSLSRARRGQHRDARARVRPRSTRSTATERDVGYGDANVI